MLGSRTRLHVAFMSRRSLMSRRSVMSRHSFMSRRSRAGSRIRHFRRAQVRTVRVIAKFEPCGSAGQNEKTSQATIYFLRPGHSVFPSDDKEPGDSGRARLG
jgi:hypothetical protein